MKKTAFGFALVTAVIFLINPLIGKTAFAEDTTPPKILEFTFISLLGNYDVYFYWKTDEPTTAKIYCSRKVPQWNNDEISWEADHFDEYTTEGKYFENPFRFGEFGKLWIEFTDKAGNVTKSPEYEISRYWGLDAHLNINNGAISTNSRDVVLNIQATCKNSFI